jgi:DNA-binding response OmpR family regulator
VLALHILLIDDNKEITTMLAKYLKSSSHEVSVSNDGRNGLNMIINNKFDVVLLDLAMPEFSGTDIIESLAKENKIKNQKIILFTASSKPEDEISELIKKGAHSCLKKPIDPDELLNYLEGLKS